MQSPGSLLSATPDDIALVRKVFLVAVLAALLATIWLLSDLLLLLFGSVLIAIALRAIASPLHTYLGLSETLAIIVVLLALIAIVSSVLILFGAELSQQVGTLLTRLPQAAQGIIAQLNIGSLVAMVQGAGVGTVASNVLSWGTTVFSVLASVVVVLFGGVYLAMSPQLYRDGLLKLIPPSLQKNIAATLDDSNDALRRWLIAQLIAMVVVGALTAVGLYLVGVPSWLALGLLSGLLEFVPYVGPIAAAIPGLIIAGTQGWELGLWALGVYVVVQQVENNILVPLLASRTVSIAPALALFAVIAMGIVFGPLGILLGFPLTVVLDIAVRRLYVRDALDEQVEILGEPAEKSAEVETELPETSSVAQAEAKV